MTSIALRRIVWKESREKFAFLLSACIAFAIAMLCWAWSWGPDQFDSNGATINLTKILNMWVNTFALLTGVMLFAPEKDNKTIGFLQLLPISAGRVATTKVVLSLVLIILLAAFCYSIVWLSAVFWGITHPIWKMPGNELVEQFLVPAECFCWGVFWSLICKRPIFAMIAATVSVLLVTVVAGVFNSNSVPLRASVSSWTVRIPVLLIVGFVSGRLSQHWLRGSTTTFVSKTAKSSAITSTLDSLNNPCQPVLVWQSFRQFRSIILVSGVALLALGFASFTTVKQGAALPICLGLIIASVSLLTFYFDQQDCSYRFFQQQVERARILWLARLLPPAAISIACAVLGTTLVNAESVARISSHYASNSMIEIRYYSLFEYMLLHLTPTKILIAALTLFATGQFCSMMFRQAIVSFFVGVCFSAAAICWSLLLLAVNASYWLFFFPLPVAMLAATWWLAPHWLADKASLKIKLTPWLIVCLASILIVAGLMFKRATEVPVYDELANNSYKTTVAAPGKLSDTPELRSAQLLYRAAELIDDDIREKYHLMRSGKLVDKNEEEQVRHADALKLVHEATKSNSVVPWMDLASMELRFQQFEKLRFLLRYQFEQAMKRDDLDSASPSLTSLFWIEREDLSFQVLYGRLICDWSDHPDQTAERIHKLLNELKRHRKLNRNNTFYEHCEFENRCDAIAEGNYLIAAATNNGLSRLNQRLHYFMPWELERTRNLGHHLLDIRSKWEKLIDNLYENDQADIASYSHLPFWQLFTSMLPETPYYEQARTSPITPYNFDSLGYEQVNDVQRIRFLLIRLALIAYKLDNGSYPERLSQLVPAYLEQVPSDIFSGGDFVYSADGMDHAVTWIGRPGRRIQVGVDRKPEIRDNHLIRSGPFLLPWSSGGGQRLLECELVIDGNQNVVEKRESLECYNYPQSGSQWRLDLSFELPQLNKN